VLNNFHLAECILYNAVATHDENCLTFLSELVQTFYSVESEPKGLSTSLFSDSSLEAEEADLGFFSKC